MLSSFTNMAASVGTEDRTRDHSSAVMASPPATSATSSSNLPTNINELLWEEKKRTLRELISSYRLPLAVKLKSGDVSKFLGGSNSTADRTGNSETSAGSQNSPSLGNGVSVGRDSNPGTPDSKDSCLGRGGQEEVILQIHETRRRKIILARKMTWEKRQNDYVVTGEQVEIPASFKGWLEVVPDDGRPVEYFDTVGGITSVKPRRFLVRTSTVGYQLSTEENGTSCWMPSEIRPGEVLTTGIIYMDNKKTKNATQRNIFKRFLKQNKVKKEQDLKYLQCFDADGREIMIPLIMSGVFSPVGDATMANYDAVFELQDLIMAFGLPVNAQLIHTNSKETFPCPRGVLRLYGTREEELAIVSRVGSSGALFSDTASCDKFEIPVDKDLAFSRGVVKKKPAIKAKLGEVFHSPWSKDKSGGVGSGVGGSAKVSDRESKDKDYVRATTVDEFKPRVNPDRRFSTPVSNKPAPVMASYGSHAHPAASPDTYREPHKTRASQVINSVPVLPPRESGTSSTYSTGSANTTIDTSVVSASVEEHQKSLEKTPDKEQKPNTEIGLPERSKELKKSKSTGILDKLSVRKVRKERAKLKALRGEDVFSKKIVRNDLSYQDFFNGLDGEEEEGASKENERSSTSKQDDSGRGSSSSTYQSNPSSPKSSVYEGGSEGQRSTGSERSKGSDYSSLVQRRQSIQNRDLPPIPPESPRGHENSSPYHHNESKESLYEHLPPAPQPPSSRRASESMAPLGMMTHPDDHEEDDEEDGYMVPMQVQREQRERERYSKRSDVVLRQKPPSSAGHESLRYSRARKARSELPSEFAHRMRDQDDGCPLDIDDLFSFAYNSKEFGENRPLGSLGSQQAISTSQLYGPGASRVPAWTSDLPPSVSTHFDQRFVDNLDLEARGHQQGLRYRSKQARNMNANPNATIRSHNLRKMRPSMMEVFHFSDSFRDIRHGDSGTEHIIGPPVDFQNSYNPHQNPYDHPQQPPPPPPLQQQQQHYYPAQNSRPPLLNSRSMDANVMTPLLPHHHHHLQQQQQQQQQQQSIYGPGGYGMHYAESEPCFRPSHHHPHHPHHQHHNPRSMGGVMSDNLVQHGDDSAISMCSRGEGGFPNESEYSYSEYTEEPPRDVTEDGWSPPDNVEGLSVQEVSKSLRYIGMKDRVVLRFSNEQIDGNMLCTLDKKLLKEGFPELNALELKKILDFVQGWRPKKR
ncbi:uncharacterized protein LOC101855593 [Aplysia californica]|uniref:Uncharacterized protein LOC101855593 n=1 Tax=Aplysia californica TaxID=6500 RepID=A0ABM0K380_APLCA|nr:uncharacterized protein LOC101855593 [Aplysia californica]